MTASEIPKNPVDAEALLAAIIESSDDGIISRDLNGNISSWNGGAARIFGYTAEEAVGRHVSIIVPPEKLEEEERLIAKVKNGERIKHFETLRRNKGGRLLTVSIAVAPIKDSSGAVLGASVVARDTSQLREAQRASAYLGAIIESSDDAIIGKDLNGFITAWNKSAERIFGYTFEEVVGKHITIIIPTERLNEEDTILTTLKTGKRVDHFETLRRHKDGHLVPVSLTVSPIRDAGGNIVGASKVSRDISDRVRAEQALRETSQKKDDFLANMSHELRTPMNAVIGLASLLKATPDMPGNAIKYVDTLKTSADHLMNLINDLLDFSKIEADSFEIENIEFDLAEQIEKVVSVMNVRAQEKGLALFVNYDPALNRYLMGDPLRLHQVLMNLLSNAVKFTDKGSIEIEIRGAPGKTPGTTQVLLKVTDTGIGIEASKLDFIFDKFTQADSSITRRFGGSGLGLAIAKTCVEKMGGQIKVDSQRGLGTTFTVVIPFGNTNKTSNVESFSVRTIPVPPRNEKNILLVDDYEPNVLVAGSMLEGEGYSYDIAKNGLEAIRMFVQGTYEIILMDVQMNELDGLQATRRIRKIEAERKLVRTPIIAMTAHVREQDKDKCLDAGMDDFIPKPFERGMLEQKIRRYMKLHKEMAQLEAVDPARKKQEE